MIPVQRMSVLAVIHCFYLDFELYSYNCNCIIWRWGHYGLLLNLTMIYLSICRLLLWAYPSFDKPSIESFLAGTKAHSARSSCGTATGSGRCQTNDPMRDAEKHSSRCAQRRALLRLPAVTLSSLLSYPKNADSKLSKPIFEFKIHSLLTKLYRSINVQFAC